VKGDDGDQEENEGQVPAKAQTKRRKCGSRAGKRRGGAERRAAELLPYRREEKKPQVKEPLRVISQTTRFDSVVG